MLGTCIRRAGVGQGCMWVEEGLMVNRVLFPREGLCPVCEPSGLRAGNVRTRFQEEDLAGVTVEEGRWASPTEVMTHTRHLAVPCISSPCAPRGLVACSQGPASRPSSEASLPSHPRPPQFTPSAGPFLESHSSNLCLTETSLLSTRLQAMAQGLL